MKSATIRDLRNSFPTVARWIQRGRLRSLQPMKIYPNTGFVVTL